MTAATHRFLLPACLLLAASSLPAAEPSTDPVLRIDAGMHTAVIKRLSTAAAGTLALTVSEDKTARLWSLKKGQEGRLLRVLRPPLGEGEEGMLFSGALSPDGSLAAVGGWTGYEWDKAISISLFDTASGRLVRRLGDLPDVVLDLAFSPGGTRLAAGLFGQNGIRVWDPATGRLLGEDADYGDLVNDLDWQGEDRLAASCFDGQVRLYEIVGAGLRKLRSVATDSGKQPSSLRFSPDGARLAIGFEDAAAVEVRDAHDLSLLFAPDTSGVDDGALNSVAWSADGRTLAAGGRWQIEGSRPVRLWSQAGRGPFRDVPASRDSLLDLHPLPGGAFLFASGDPAWGVLSESGVETLGAPPVADYRELHATFLLAPDGSSVAFEYEPFGKSPAVFHLLQTKLAPGQAAPADGLRPPRTEGLPVTDWFNTTEPKLGGKALPLQEREISRSLAIAPDASCFLLGTEWALRCFEADGQERWSVPVPGTAWAVNLTQDGRYAVAAYHDGSIRWHDMANKGRELLAFFPHADQKRWALWTPGGYFVSSEGGQDLIGWHVNRGKAEEATFFSVDQLWDAFRRPDIVQRVFAEAKTSEEVAKELGIVFDLESALRQTPQLSIVGVDDGATVPTGTLRVTVEALNVGGGLNELAFYHNGKRLPPEGEARGGRRDGRLLVAESYVVTLEPGENLLKAQAANDAKTLGHPAQTLVHFHGEEAHANLHVFAIGLNQYLNPALNLSYCVPDAEATSTAFRQRSEGLFAEVHVHQLLDAEATRPRIEAKFAELASSAKPQDVFVFIYAGHGAMGEAVEDGGDPTFYLVPHDVTQIYGNPERLAEKAVSRGDLEDWCAKVPARKQLMLLDTCQSGGLVDSFAMRGAAEQKAIAQLARATGTVVIASTGAEAFARESAEIGHGIFTKALLDGLTGAKADANKDGRITVKELELHINEAVPELSRELTGAPQFPTSYSRGQDFPVGVVR